MQPDERKAMLKAALCTLCICLTGCVPLAQADTGAQAAADRLAAMLEKVDSVSFYFVSRTGSYSFRGNQFKDESSIKIHRRCGANCAVFMEKVISHLRQATLANCRPGQQNLLIEAGDVGTILYSFSGRMIEFERKCYFNSKGVDSTVKSAEFLFG